MQDGWSILNALSQIVSIAIVIVGYFVGRSSALKSEGRQAEQLDNRIDENRLTLDKILKYMEQLDEWRKQIDMNFTVDNNTRWQENERRWKHQEAEATDTRECQMHILRALHALLSGAADDAKETDKLLYDYLARRQHPNVAGELK